MNHIQLSVDGNILKVVQEAASTQGSAKYDSCSFTFDNEWDGFTKTAVFSTENDDSYKVLIENGSCLIPSVCLEKEGNLRIAVFGINDSDVVITTNTVAHRVEEGICGLSEWIEEDFSLAQNAVSQLRSEIAQFNISVTSQIGLLLSRMNKAETGIKENVRAFADWYLPEAVTDAADCPVASGGATYNDFLDFRLSGLVEDFPDYVSRTEIGQDESGDYSVYAYTFEPEHYDKTILITTCVHGTERIAFLALSYFLDNLCRGNDKVLNYIKENIKLQVIPVVNPYGLANTTVNNSANVNLNMNFPSNWDICTSIKKGSSAGNQAETQNVMQFMDDIKNDRLCAVIDLHTNSGSAAGRTIFYPRFRKNCLSALTDLAESFNYEISSSGAISKAIVAPSINPTLTNYAAEQFDVNACELVWNNSLYGGIYSNYTLTKFVEFIGNAVYTMAKNSRYTKKTFPSPFAKHIFWHSSDPTDVYSITSTSALQKMGISAYSMCLDTACILTANGSVTINATSDCTVKINPVLYQVNSAEQEYAERLASPAFSHEIELTQGTHVIPVSTILQAYHTDYNETDDSAYCEEVLFVLAFACSVSGGANVTDFSVTLNGIPSDRAKPVEITSPMGLVSDYSANELPTQSIIYPLGTYADSDGFFND